jgi:hypothetical protein
MKQVDWVKATNPIKMLEFLEKRAIRARRLRLFAAACCRRAWMDIANAGSRDAIAALECFTDGPGKQADQAALKIASDAADAAVEETVTDSRSFYAARTVASAVSPMQAWWTARWSADLWLSAVGKSDKNSGSPAPQTLKKREKAILVSLLRDIIPDPFSSIILTPTQRTPTVVSLAQAAYEERQLPSGELDPHRLSVLADALEEAGAPGELVTHLRGPGPHVRGCFVVDLVLHLS